MIDARSLKASNEATAKFVRGPSMLNTQAHPEIAYRAQRIVFSQGRPARIEGELTLLGVTRSVALLRLQLRVHRARARPRSLRDRRDGEA